MLRCALLLVVLSASSVAGAPIDLRFKDDHFLIRSLKDFPERKAIVIVFVDSGCPLAKRYFPTLQSLETTYRSKGVQFLAIHTDSTARLVEVAGLGLEHQLEFPIVRDIDGQCVAKLKVERTPEVVILDAEHKVRYQGRIDDQFRTSGSRNTPTRHDLREAIDDVLAGKEVRVPTTTVDGCLITKQESVNDPSITYSEHIAPIMNRYCVECHRADAVGPFVLTDFAAVKKRAKSIGEVVIDGQMPPWFGAPGHDHFANRRVPSASEREQVTKWVRSGMPEGDRSKLPKAPTFPDMRDGWQISKPDVILETQEFEIPAQGDVTYQYAVLPSVFFSESWLSEIQILPDNPRVVHHSNMAFASLSKQFDMSNFVTGYVPGGEPMELQNKVAYRLPKLSILALQIHFVTTGKPEKCKLRVGLKYANGEVRQQLRFLLFDPHRFQIPAHAPAHRVDAQYTLDCNAVGVGLFTHMHLRGKSMTFRATPPTGEKKTLLMIPNYDFEWQIPYVWEPEKHRFPKGTKIECSATYDNSAFNPFNPAPDKVVRYGDQTRDEMMNGFFFYVDADENLKLDIDGKTGQPKVKK